MIIFDGKNFAADKEALLLPKVQELISTHHRVPKVVSVVFIEDEGGVVYAKEKQTVANRLGIGYEVVETSIAEPLTVIQGLIKNFATNSVCTGIIIQKPWRNTWAQYQTEHSTLSFQNWWHQLTSLIPAIKDIDGLHPDLHTAIQKNTWKQERRVLPATCKGVLSILDHVNQSMGLELAGQPVAIIGRSDLLGSPLFYELHNRGWKDVQLFGQKELNQADSTGESLLKYKTIVSSTGVKDLIRGTMISENTVLIDAGFPSGDIEFGSVQSKAAFLTPVPNGVGPVTVISLLENTVELCYNSIS